jgi:hypothetical protein
VKFVGASLASAISSLQPPLKYFSFFYLKVSCWVPSILLAAALPSTRGFNCLEFKLLGYVISALG